MTEIIPSLVFDSTTDVVPGVRNAKDDRNRHLIYEGGGVILDLILKKGQGGAYLQIAGQVLPSSEVSQNVSDVPVRIRQGSQEQWTRSNVLGEFAFRSISGAALDLFITLADHTFTVRGLGNSEARAWQVIAR